ncbi:hypothetical protein U1Q18_037709 [Sarracenia purpurea var. burkii]
MMVFASLSLQKPALPPRQGPTTNSKRWNSAIKRHTKLKEDRAILDTCTQIEAQGILPNSFVLAAHCVFGSLFRLPVASHRP